MQTLTLERGIHSGLQALEHYSVLIGNWTAISNQESFALSQFHFFPWKTAMTSFFKNLSALKLPLAEHGDTHSVTPGTPETKSGESKPALGNLDSQNNKGWR